MEFQSVANIPYQYMGNGFNNHYSMVGSGIVFTAYIGYLIIILIIGFVCYHIYKSYRIVKVESFENPSFRRSSVVRSPWQPDENPADYTLYRGDEPTYAPQGTPLPLENTPVLLQNNDAPEVDGTVNAPKSLAMFAYNKSRPECCYGVNGGYSTSGGCVCVSEEQERYLSDVGGNRKRGYMGIS